MKVQQFPYEIAAALRPADASQQQCRGAVTNWQGAVLMLRYYRSKSLWEHITIMFSAMSQISTTPPPNIGKTLSDSESSSFLYCVFFF